MDSSVKPAALRNKSIMVNARLHPDIKALLDEVVSAESRTFTNWLESTVKREHAKLRSKSRRSE